MAGCVVGALICRAALGVTAVDLELVATNTFSNPVSIARPGDGSGRLFVVERGGLIKIWDGTNVLATPFLNASGLVTTNGAEQGLLGLAFHPQYASNGVFFINYTRAADGATVIARYSNSVANVADPASSNTVLVIAQPQSNHNGGQLQFGPDGSLYIGMGDGGGSCDSSGAGNNAQNLNALLGKLLRIDINTNQSYRIPPSNPFVGPTVGLDEIWAYGLRNPWRFSFDRVTGDLFIGDVGQGPTNPREEVDFQPAASTGGENYGWRCFEGFLTNTCGVACSNYPSVLPIFDFDHSNGNCAVIGGYRYRGTQIPGLYADYIFGDFCSGKIWAATQTDSRWSVRELLDLPVSITSFGEDDNGELYVTTYPTPGRLFRFVDKPQIVAVDIVSTNVVVQFTTVAGSHYRVERTGDLVSGTWSLVVDNVPGTGGIVPVTDTGAATLSNRFYRARSVQ